MNQNLSKRILKGVLAFGLFASVLPTPVMAAQEVPTTPGNGNLPVEYFNTTFFKWDEDKANQVTAKADSTTEAGYVGTDVSYETVATDDNKNYTKTNYWYKAGDEQYYRVYYIRETSGFWPFRQTKYTLYYKSGTDYKEIGTTIDGRDNIHLYQISNEGHQEGKGFYFTEAANKQETPSFSKWSGYDQNFYIYTGLAEKNLSESTNAPFSNDNVNAANLFATDDTNNDYTKVYTDVQVPYVYDEETGYYELNSDKWAVYFEGGSAQSNTTLKIADKPVAFKADVPQGTICGFQPFENVSDSTISAYKGTSESESDQITAYQLDDGNPTYGFGMVTTVNFQMTDDGNDENGNPIEFNFSGDDDVWVYVDGVLALDIGGTHDAITGTINFESGDVTLSAAKYGQVGDKATDPNMENPTSGTMNQGNLYKILGMTKTGFASQGNHTLTIYYMDRGRGATNCRINFNLPQRDTVSVTKTIDKAKDNDGSTSSLTEEEQATVNKQNYTFTLYENGRAVSNKTYYLYEGDKLINSRTTGPTGEFYLANNQTAKFIVDISETGNTYFVKEKDLTGAGYKTPDYSVNEENANVSIETGQEEFTSMKVKATGSDTAADSISFVCENYLDKNLPNPGAELVDDTYVIDYGLPLHIENVMANDNWRGDEAKITGVVAKEGFESYGKITQNEDGSIDYQLLNPIDRVIELEYTVEVSGKGNTGSTETVQTITETATIYIVPATSMYYEENFSDMISYSNNPWNNSEVDNNYGRYQEEGNINNNKASYNPYGADEIYLNNLGDSNGTSKYVETNKGFAAQFIYKFSGTGTTIYSRISPDSAYIRVEIKSEDGSTADLKFIDTRVIGSVGSDQILYNVPVYDAYGLDYGDYQVTVTVYKKGTPVQGYNDANGEYAENSSKSGGKFYLDGIRVYNPLNPTDTNYELAQNAYASDNESNSVVMNIHDKVMKDDFNLGLNDFVTLTDGFGDDNISIPEIYNNIGPTNELYLNENEEGADPESSYHAQFYLLNWDSQKYRIYLGLRTPSTSPVTVKIGDHEIKINNTADCYYDISNFITVTHVDMDDDGNNETSLGVVDISSASGLVSLTNIKVTGQNEFDIGYSKDVNVDGSEGSDSDTLYFLPSTFKFGDKGDKDEGTSSEPSYFEPKQFDINANYAKLFKKTTIRVSTQTDVAYIEVNGEKKSPTKTGTSYVFTYIINKATQGTEYEIIAYDRDGIASKTYSVVA